MDLFLVLLLGLAVLLSPLSAWAIDFVSYVVRRFDA